MRGGAGMPCRGRGRRDETRREGNTIPRGADLDVRALREPSLRCVGVSSDAYWIEASQFPWPTTGNRLAMLAHSLTSMAREASAGPRCAACGTTRAEPQS
jgi:hypothetical protein